MDSPRGDDGERSGDREAAGWAQGGLESQGWASSLARLGLDRDPFAPGIDVDASLLTGSARRALDFVQLALMQLSPVTLVLGAPGTGKTTLIHRVLRRAASGGRAGVLTARPDGGDDLFARILAAFGETVPDGADAARTRFLDLVAEGRDAGRATLLVVDDAHLAPREYLMALGGAQRMTEGEVLPLLLLVGEPVLRQRLTEPELGPLAQRAEAITGLGPITAEETAGLVRHRLEAADGPNDLFDEEALAVLHEAAHGVPGAVRILAGRSLELAAAEGHRTVDAALVRRVLDERSPQPSSPAEGGDDPDAPLEELDWATRDEPGGETPPEPADDEGDEGWLSSPDPALAYSLDLQQLAELEPLEWETDAPVAEPIPPGGGDRRAGDDAPEEPVPQPRGAGGVSEEPAPAASDPGPDTPADEFEAPDEGVSPPGPVEHGPSSVEAGAAPLRLVHPVPAEKGPTPSAPEPEWPGRRDGAAAVEPAPLLLTGRIGGAPPGRHDLARRRRDGAPASEGREGGAVTARRRPGRDLLSAVVNGGLVAGAAAVVVILTVRPELAPLPHRPTAVDAPPASASADELFREALGAAAADPEAAAIAYARAAIRGHDRAAYYLGQLYETGDGVPLDRARARAWYEIASGGIDPAARRLAQLPPPGSTALDTKDLTPVPLYSGRTANGEAELVWAGPKGAAGFTVEVARDPEGGADLSEALAATAARVPLPGDAAYWRVVVDGQGDAATPWLPIDAGRWVEG